MNERLLDLMRQADYPAPEIALRAQRLAELIVRQCIFEMMHESTLQDNTKIQDFSVAVANRIEKHFGVEE
jgi:hypothetical protein